MVVFGESDGAGEGRLVLAWDGEGTRRELAFPLAIGASKLGETLWLLHGARLITDLESRVVPEEAVAAARRQQQRVDQRLEALSQAYGLASRRMALVVVVERPADRPGELPQTRVVPVGMPQDTPFASYFGPPQPMAAPVGAMRFSLASLFARPRPSEPQPMAAPRRLARVFARKEREPEAEVEREHGPADLLLELAAKMEPDGGMPGRNLEERVQATVLALLSFLAEGHTARRGSFRSHVRRLIAFLEAAAGLNPVVGEIVELARRGGSLEGDWGRRGPGPALWAEVGAALKRATC